MRTRAPINFLVSSRDFLLEVIDLFRIAIGLVRAYIRYAWRVWPRTLRVSWEMRRPISLASYLEHTEKEIAETHQRTLDRLVPHLFFGWAFVEIMLDYTNLYIINNFETNENHLPISLKAKIAFYKKHFLTIGALQTHQERALGSGPIK
jgi:hypothetical protein